MKPEKYTWFEFASKPFIKLFNKFIHAVKIEVLGYWECNYCKSYHSPRTIKYVDWKKSDSLFHHYRHYCSLGEAKFKEEMRKRIGVGNDD